MATAENPTGALDLKSLLQSAISAQNLIPTGKVTLQGILEVIQKMIETAIPLAQNSGLDGPAKKAAVVEVLMGVITPLVKAIDIPYVPDFVEATAIDPFILEFLRNALNVGIDSLVALFNRYNLWKPAS